jgi:hypothetical protein
MKVRIFDFPNVSSEHYDQLRASLIDGRPLTNIADFHRVGYLVASHVVATTPNGPRLIDVWGARTTSQNMSVAP